jgi:hypothetical protein
MIKDFYLPGLNSKSQDDIERKKENKEFEEIIKTVDEKNHNSLYNFINNIDNFYSKSFNNLEDCKIREKRLIEFETPNRAKITHEYDIQIKGNKKSMFDEYNYLFNPKNRLSWLKIKQDGKRIIVADNNIVKESIKNKLIPDLKKVNLSKINPDDFYDYLWERKDGYPCFIKLEYNCQKNILIEAEYYDSIKENNKKSKNGNIFCPFEERRILYEYYPLKNYSSWLYIRAPKNFNVEIEKDIDYSEEINDVIHYDKENKKENSDPDIKTLTIINKKEADKEKYIVKLNIKITIPKSLKCWFKSIYFISGFTVLLLLINIVNHIYLIKYKPLFDCDFLEKLIENDNFHRIVLALIAGIITTRGWLISEETILSKYSKYLTIFMVLLIVIPIILSVLK